MKRFLRKIYNSIRFGHVRPVIKCTVAGTVAEIAYVNSRGETVGYWAYGDFARRSRTRSDYTIAHILNKH